MKKTKINSPEFAERMGAYSHGYKEVKKLVKDGCRVEIEAIAVKIKNG